MNIDEMTKWIEENLEPAYEGCVRNGLCGTTDEFYGKGGNVGIWIAADNRDKYKGEVIYEYFSQDYEKRDIGVLKSWEEELNKRGWYSEWNDPGTVMIWKIGE